jgi:hypothetical protein
VGLDTTLKRVTRASGKGALGTWRSQAGQRRVSEEPAFADEPEGKRGMSGVDASQRLSFLMCRKAVRGKPGSEPYSGNPTVRDRRGACGNVDARRARRSSIPTQVGRIRARYPKARFPNPPVRPVRATFIAHGSRKRELYRRLPLHQLHGLHRGQLTHSLATFVPLSPPSSSGPLPWTRLSRVPTPLPHLTACGALEFRLGFPLPTLHPPCHPWQALPCSR